MTKESMKQRSYFWLDSFRVLLFVIGFLALLDWLLFASPEARKNQVRFAEPVKSQTYPKNTQKFVDPLKILVPKISIAATIDSAGRSHLVWQNSINHSKLNSTENILTESDDNTAWLHLDEKTKLQWSDFSPKDLNLNKAFTLIIAFQDSGLLSTEDLFSWGNCDQDRFTAHLPFHGSKFLFEFGNPLENPIQAPFASAQGQWRTLVLEREEGIVTLIIDNHLYEFHDLWTSLSETPRTLIIGNSACGNPFNGKLGEFIYFNSALNPNKVEESLNSLRNKFHIPD